MTNQFKVGDLVIMQKANFFHEYDGYVGIIVGGLSNRSGLNTVTMKYELVSCYDVKILKAKDCLAKEGMYVCAKPHQLRPLGDNLNEDQNKEENKLRPAVIT